MDPVTAAIFVGASLAASLYTNKQQSKIEQSSIKIQGEQAKLQAAETALERTKSFRQNASMNLALSGMGFGGNMGFVNAFNEGFGNYSADIAAINRGAEFASLTGIANTASSKTNRLSNDATSISNAAMLASNLGLFSSGGGKVKKPASLGGKLTNRKPV